jgi:hypothetical protein
VCVKRGRYTLLLTSPSVCTITVKTHSYETLDTHNKSINLHSRLIRRSKTRNKTQDGVQDTYPCLPKLPLNPLSLRLSLPLSLLTHSVSLSHDSHERTISPANNSPLFFSAGVQRITAAWWLSNEAGGEEEEEEAW